MSADVYLTIEADTGGEKPIFVDVYANSITSNLVSMAKLANLYLPIWKPSELPGGGVKTARFLSPHLKKGIVQLKNKDMLEEYLKRENKRGFGTYQTLLMFSEQYLKACENNPKCKILVES